MPCDLSQFLKGLDAAKSRAESLALRAVDRFGEHVLGDAQQLCPVDTGALHSSGTAEPAKLEGEQVSKTIGFNVSYAAAVHERLELHHDQGQAKFLSAAIEANASKMGPFVADEIKAGMEGAG